MAHVFGEGGHSDDHGGAMLPYMLRWIWRDAPGIKPPQEDLVALASAIKPQRQDLFPGFDEQADIDPSGTWAWDRRFGPNTTSYKVTISEVDGELSASCQFKRGENDWQELKVGAPEMTGNKVTFDVTLDFNGRPFTVTYQGVVSDDSVQGWSMTSRRRRRGLRQFYSVQRNRRYARRVPKDHGDVDQGRL